MADKLIISFEDYLKTVEKLAVKIRVIRVKSWKGTHTHTPKTKTPKSKTETQNGKESDRNHEQLKSRSRIQVWAHNLWDYRSKE